jgi:hypothetical protein
VWQGATAQPESQRERAAKQNKVTVMVLCVIDVAFNSSVCCCCYASQWKSKLLAPLSRGMTLPKMTLTWQQKQQQGDKLNYVQLKLLKPEQWEAKQRV